MHKSLNAPTGAWCSLTRARPRTLSRRLSSQCTYRCVVLPDQTLLSLIGGSVPVSMHLQVRGAP